jgi:TolA-binding protein
MAFRREWLLIWFTLVLSGGELLAASTREDRAYAAAISAFQDGMWSRAETEFARFTVKYPDSDRVAGAVLLQAEAGFKQGKYPEIITLLTLRKPGAGDLADQYVYWIGEAQFQAGDLSAAAETFISLARDFPQSSLRLRAVVEAAAAHAQLGEWPRLGALLEPTNSVFQRAVQMDPANELVARGSLLLAQARFAQADLAGAAAVLESLDFRMLKPDLDWQRAYLLYQVKLATGDTNAALAATTNLVQIARSKKDDALQAEGVALRARVLEQLGQTAAAMAAYAETLTLNAPVERQRQAILKMAELAIAQGQFSDAEQSLEKFRAQFPVSPATDVALLTLGELHLKDYIAQLEATNHLPVATNHLPEAQARFDQFLHTCTNSPLAGKAYLDRGWCLWLAARAPESFEAFQAAAQRLPPSEDLALARFKMGDALFAQKDYTNALENYRRVVDDFADFPAVTQTLGDRALYQMLRANLELQNLAGANSALARILKLYPASDLADSGLLLVGEGLADARQPAAARALFQKFAGMFPNSPLRPQVELAIARSYEQEQNWPAAISQYESWRGDFPTNAARPRADYALAWANFQAGNEPNAFQLFTNFVGQFPTHELAPLAQLWVADHYFRLGGTNYMDAERNYKMLYQNTNWQGSPLIYQARLMAGRAALGLPSYPDAIDHFQSLTSDTNCPPDLNAQALFAYGSALMLKDSPDTNNPLANFQTAVSVFNQICERYPTNELNAQAWIGIGKSNLQLTNYDGATNAYAQVLDSPYADIAARSQAQIGLGLVLEKKADLATGLDQTNLLQMALNNYLRVFDTWTGKDLRDGEVADEFWVKKAGLQALPLMQMLGAGDPDKFIDQLEKLFPQSQDSLEKKRPALPRTGN